MPEARLVFVRSELPVGEKMSMGLFMSESRHPGSAIGSVLEAGITTPMVFTSTVYLEFFSAPPFSDSGSVGPEDSELEIRFSATPVPEPGTAVLMSHASQS